MILRIMQIPPIRVVQCQYTPAAARSSVAFVTLQNNSIWNVSGHLGYFFIMPLFYTKKRERRSRFFPIQRSLHAPRVIRASMGISSRRPVSISSDSTSLLSGDRMEKFSIGPRIPRPGPTLLMQVRDAAKDS